MDKISGGFYIRNVVALTHILLSNLNKRENFLAVHEKAVKFQVSKCYR